MLWLVRQTMRGAPRRMLLAAVAVAFPVAALAATLLFVDSSVQAMTRTALRPVQVDMRVLATSLGVDMTAVDQKLKGVPGVRQIDHFGSADVVVSAPGSAGRVTARLFAVDPSYFDHHHSWLNGSGDLRRGAMVSPAIAGTPGFERAPALTIDLRGDAAPLRLTVPVAGQIDLRQATTWFAIPTSEVQGDIAMIPRSIVIDYATFQRAMLPALIAALGSPSAVINPGLSELPPASVEAHLTLDHRSYPSDPARAAGWSASLRRVLERRAPGSIIVADNTAEPLAEASVDATNAKVLFFLLGIPGVLVAAALGLAAASALTEAQRRDNALLRLRGASDTQLVRLEVGQGLVAGGIGLALGLAVAVAVVSATIGHAVWHDASGGALTVTILLACGAGSASTATRLIPLVRSGRKSELGIERRRLTGHWIPTWRRARLDVVALVAGLAILGGNVLVGGLKPIPIEGQALALSFYVLLAPVALWIGVTLLIVRAGLALLTRWSRPDRPRPLSSWTSTSLRWLGRRPARTTVALVLGALAVAFGTEAATFVATYRSAKQADTRAAFGADLRIAPPADRVQPLPALGAEVRASTAIRTVPARAGSDRKSMMAIDISSYRSAAIAAPQIVRGRGLDALASDKGGVLVAQELAKTFAISPGDTLPVTVFPDDRDLAQKLDLHVVGVYRAFPPTDPLSELVVTTATLPAPVPPPDFWLARVAPGSDPARVATSFRQRRDLNAFSITVIADRVRLQQRSLTALNLDGLSRIESLSAAATAAVGIAVLGAFIVLERRREFAILESAGATTRQIVTGPALEGSIAVLGSLVIGLPVGLGVGLLAVRVLGLFFTLPPPLLNIPVGALAGLAGTVIVASALSLTIALVVVTRLQAATVLREP